MNQMIDTLSGTPMESATKHVHKTKIDEAIFKATTSKNVPSKAKHERTILIETWNARTSSHVFAELFKRPLGGKDIVIYKTSIIIHKMLRDGHPQCLEDAYTRKEFLEAMKSQLGSITAMTVMDEAYLTFLIEKILFHKAHPEIGGEISLAKFKEKNAKLGVKQSVSIVNKMLSLQKCILNLQQKVMQSAGLNEVRVAGLIPCLAESYGIYTFAEYLLNKLIDTDADIDGLIDTFEKQFPLIQKFYFTCSTIPFITTQMSVPKLGKPPQFKRSEIKKKPKQEGNIINPNLLVSGSGLLSSGQGLLGSGSGLLNSGSGLVGSNPLVNSGSSLYDPFSNQAYGSGGFGAGNFGANAYGNSAFGGNTFGGNNSNSSFGNPFLQVPSNTYAASTPQYQPPQDNSPFGSTTNQLQDFSDLYSMQNQQTLQESYAFSESKDDLEKKIRELEARAIEIENQIRDIDGQNDELKLLLKDRNAGLASVNKQMEERLSSQQQQFQEAHNALKGHLDRVSEKYEKEKLSLVKDQLEFAKKGVDQTLSRFEDPSSVGNRGASAEDIVQVVNQVQDKYHALMNDLENVGDIVGSSRALTDRTAQFAEDIKGALARIVDPNIKSPLSDHSKNTVMEVSRLLSHALQLAPQGKPDERQVAFLKGEQSRFNQTVEAVKYYLMQSQQNLKLDTRYVELESMAEKELANAFKIVEESSSALRQRRTQINSNTPNSEVASSLIDAVMAITNGTSLLVKAAVAAQQERVKNESTGLVGQSYHRDPMWIEALIAAAKAVAAATQQIVNVAFQCTQPGGKIDDIALTSASKAVAAATAQLVAASRSKGDTQTQQALDNAATAVTRATRALVDAAKSFSNAEEMEIMKKSDLFAKSVKEEIVQQTKILRLEKDLDFAKKQLLQMKRNTNQSTQQQQPQQHQQQPQQYQQPQQHQQQPQQPAAPQSNPFNTSFPPPSSTFPPPSSTFPPSSAFPPPSSTFPPPISSLPPSNFPPPQY